MKLAGLPAVILAVILFAGCASVTPEQCREAYDLGYRDAIMGAQAQDIIWTPLCQQQGSSLDGKAYIEGWKDGRYEFDKRTPHIE